MKTIEIFENLFEPLRLELGNDSWEFLMKRGQMFINQCVSVAPQESVREELIKFKVWESWKCFTDMAHTEIVDEYLKDRPEADKVSDEDIGRLDEDADRQAFGQGYERQ
jgi:hypothetical protein